jgi:hypothetical protein
MALYSSVDTGTSYPKEVSRISLCTAVIDCDTSRSEILQPSDPPTDASGESGHLLLWDLQDARTPAHRRPLLLVVGRPGRQRGHMPMEVGVTLVAAEGEDVHPLRPDLFPNRLRCSVNESL